MIATKNSQSTKTLQNALTKAQQSFFADFLGDILFGDDAKLKNVDRETFVAHVSKLSFDGEATQGECRIAHKLKSQGFLKNLDFNDHIGDPHIAVQFNEIGAGCIYDIMLKIEEKNID